MEREKLAIHGGTPIRSKGIWYGRQYIDDDDIQAVVDVLKGQYITCGPKVDEFEARMCELTGAKYCVVVSSGTSALHLSCLAAGIKQGDEVITSSMTFAASANCVLYCGARPVFADIDSSTYNISPKSIRECITDRTKAVIAVDFTGQAAELDEIGEICKEHNLLFIEDAAHAIGTKYKEKSVGNIADLTTFSFHPVKTITGGEGGAVTTNDIDLYKRLLRLRSHGITRDREEMIHPQDGLWYNEQVELGYNYRMTDFQAALLCSQMNKLSRFKNRRTEIVNRYNEAFESVPEITIQKEIEDSDTVRHLYIIQLNLEMLNASRKDIFDALYAEKVCPQVHYMPVYYHSYYESLGYHKGLCPNAEYLYERIISIPCYYAMTDQDIDDVIQAVKKVIAYYRKG